MCVCVCFQYHPDRFSGNTPSEAESALKRFLEIDAAWRILKDRESRRQYDLKLRGRSTDQAPVLLPPPTWTRTKCSVEAQFSEPVLL